MTSWPRRKTCGGSAPLPHTDKPSPDIFATAWNRLGMQPRVLVFGDTVYDIEAAKKLDIPCVGLVSGGIERDLLMKAGAVAVYNSPADVLPIATKCSN